MGIFWRIQNNLNICDTVQLPWPRSSANKVQPNFSCGCSEFSMGFFLGLYLVHGFRWVLIFTPIWWPLSLEIWSTPLAVDTWSQERGYELTLMVSNLWHQRKANFSPWSNLQMTNFPTFQRRYDGKHPFPRHLNHCAFHLHGCIFGCLQHAWVWRSHYLGPLFPEKLTCTGMK